MKPRNSSLDPFGCSFCDAEFDSDGGRGYQQLQDHMILNHSDKLMTCGRRNDMFAFRGDVKDVDYWSDKGTCSYCGSLSPQEFFRLVEAGHEVEPTDKNYKVYVRGAQNSPTGKFYFQHLTESDMRHFVDLLNEKRMNIGYPGYFYRKPYFIVYKNVRNDP